MIDTSSWKEFDVTDFFTVLAGRNKLSNVDIDNGNTPVYSSNSFNGGIFGYTTKEPDYEINEDIPFYITFGDHTKAVNIADKSFCVMDNVKVLTTKIRNYNVLYFIITSWLKNVPNLGYARHWSIAEKTKIYLPATSDGQPDWDYMESYMKAVMEESEKSLENLRKADDTKHLIDVSGWGEFRVGDLFDMSLSKDDIQPKSIIEGNIPLISSGKTNNGIVAYIQDDKATIQKANTITVDMFGKAFYQVNPYYCVSHGRVNILTSKFDMNEYIGMFVAIAIEKVSNEKYEFDSMCTGTKLAEDIIRLPITSTGEPDWQYMEDYMRRIMDKSEQIISDLQIGA